MPVGDAPLSITLTNNTLHPECVDVTHQISFTPPPAPQLSSPLSLVAHLSSYVANLEIDTSPDPTPKQTLSSLTRHILPTQPTTDRQTALSTYHTSLLRFTLFEIITHPSPQSAVKLSAARLLSNLCAGSSQMQMNLCGSMLLEFNSFEGRNRWTELLAATNVAGARSSLEAVLACIYNCIRGQDTYDEMNMNMNSADAEVENDADVDFSLLLTNVLRSIVPASQIHHQESTMDEASEWGRRILMYLISRGNNSNGNSNSNCNSNKSLALPSTLASVYFHATGKNPSLTTTTKAPPTSPEQIILLNLVLAEVEELVNETPESLFDSVVALFHGPSEIIKIADIVVSSQAQMQTEALAKEAYLLGFEIISSILGIVDDANCENDHRLLRENLSKTEIVPLAVDNLVALTRLVKEERAERSKAKGEFRSVSARLVTEKCETPCEIFYSYHIMATSTTELN